MFSISISSNQMPCLEFYNPSEKLRTFLYRAIRANYMDDPFYIAKQDASPFIQCDSEEYILIEFWGKGYEEYVSFLSEKFVDFQR